MPIVFRFSIRKFESKPKLALGYYWTPAQRGEGINLVALIGICKCEMFIFMRSQCPSNNGGGQEGSVQVRQGEGEAISISRKQSKAQNEDETNPQLRIDH